jgi:hypothetical protein
MKMDQPFGVETGYQVPAGGYLLAKAYPGRTEQHPIPPAPSPVNDCDAQSEEPV